MKDILLDDNLDLLIENGDFVIGDAEQQNQELILIATQGSFRESPLTGVGMIRFYKSSFTVAKVDASRQKIRLQLLYDGYNDISVVLNSFTDIQIQASR